ncbi:MAG: bacteriophage holin [Desulfatiglandales bacterium]
MKLNIKALALAIGILWAAAIFIVGVANLIWPGYGVKFLEVMASIYPGFKATRSFGDVIAGTLYALVDGGICGLLFGWLYNLFVGKKSAP